MKRAWGRRGAWGRVGHRDGAGVGQAWGRDGAGWGRRKADVGQVWADVGQIWHRR